MQAPTFSPAIPGVTSPRGGTDRAVPSVLRALEREGDDRASALVGVAKEWFAAHKWYYRESTECLAFYGGSHHGRWLDRINQWVARPETRHNDMIRVTVNAIKPAVDTAVALLTQESPIFGCAAAKDEARDTAAAQAGDTILDYYWTQNRLVETYRSSARDAFITGSSPVLVEWDTQAGRIQPVLGADGTPEFSLVDDPSSPLGINFQPKEEAVGDLRFRQLPRESVAFEPGADTDQSGVGIFVRERVLRSALRDQFPESAEKIPERSTTDDGDDDQREGHRADRASSQPTSNSGRRTDAEVVDVYTLYLRKCPKYPQGLMVKFVEETVLYEGDNPVYPKKVEPDALWPRFNWPVFFVKCDERTLEPWGRGRVIDMLDPQRGLNGVVSKALQHVATIANTKVMLPKTADFEWSDEIGQVLRLSRMVAPNQIGYLSPPNFPQEFVVMWDRFKAELEYAAGINASSMGQSPTSDASGRMVQLLQQKDTGRIAPVKRSIDATWAEIMRYALFLFRRHADQKRQILVVGENDEVSLKFLSGADLSAATDVRVFNDQMIPHDPSQRMLWLQQFTQTLLSVPDPGARKMVMRLARVKDFEGFLADLDPSEAKSLRMIQQVLLGAPVYVWPGDDAMAMAQEIDRFAATREYELLVEREKGMGGWSKTEGYLSQLYAYYKGVATGQAPVMPAGFMAPPQAPAPPMMTPPGLPMGSAMPPMLGAPMPGPGAPPPPMSASPPVSTPLARVAA